MTERPLCPDPEALGAFADGTASEQEIGRIREHLATCNDCLDEVGEVTRFATEEGAEKVVAMRPAGSGRRGGWLAAAAALVVVATGSGVWRMAIYDPANALRRSLPSDSRLIEPRLYRFPFRDYHVMRDGNGPPPHLEFAAVAANVVLDAGAKPSGKTKHAVAVAKLLEWQEEGNIADAVKGLQELADSDPDNAKNWSDLAAAQLIAADHSNERDYSKALAAADRALQLDPNLREALFNRALILERMDRTAEAKTAWQRYIQLEQDPDWKKEAQDKLDDLQ